MKGVIKWYDFRKKFGFVRADGIDRDIFLHESGISDSVDKFDLVQGAEVDFTLEQVIKGFEAKNLEIINSNRDDGHRDSSRPNLIGRRIQRVIMDDNRDMPLDEDGIYIKAIVLEGGQELPLVVDFGDNEEDEAAVFLGYSKDAIGEDDDDEPVAKTNAQDRAG